MEHPFVEAEMINVFGAPVRGLLSFFTRQRNSTVPDFVNITVDGRVVTATVLQKINGGLVVEYIAHREEYGVRYREMRTCTVLDTEYRAV